MELIFYAQAAGILVRCHSGISQARSRASRGPLIYAQDAWIRLRHFFHVIVYAFGVCILCAGCGDPRLLHFGFSLGMPCGLSVSSWWLFFSQTAAIRIRKHLIVTPACEPLQAKGSLGLVWAHLGSPRLGLPRLSKALLSCPGL